MYDLSFNFNLINRHLPIGLFCLAPSKIEKQESARREGGIRSFSEVGAPSRQSSFSK